MEQYDVNLREYWRIFRKRKITVLLATVLLGAASAAFAVFLGPPPLFESICSVQFSREQPVEGVYEQTVSWGAETSLQAQISLMTSYQVMQEVAERLGSVPPGLTEADLQRQPGHAQVIDALRGRVSVFRERNTNIINIAATDPDPRMAQRTADTVAQTYQDFYLRDQGRRQQRALAYLASELDKTRAELRTAEDEFNDFTRVHQLVSIDLQGEGLLTRTRELQAARQEAETASAELGELLVRLERFVDAPTGYGGDLYSTYANAEYETVRARLVEDLLARDSLLEEYTPSHPTVVAMNRRIVETARKMAVVAQAQRASLANQMQRQERALAEVEDKINVLMERRLTYERHQRRVESYNAKVAMLEEKNREAALRQAEKPDEVRIVKPAFLPSTPVNPPKVAAIASIGVFVGLILGMIAALVREAFDTSVGATDEVEETVGAKVVGVIPDEGIREIRELLREGRMRADGSPLRQTMHLVSHFVPKSMVAESFRALRINVQFLGKERGIKTLAVTSATPQEGKTVVSVNLAVSMAQAGKRVLLVGADLRKPMVSEAFGVDLSPGLTDILLGNYFWRDAIKTITDLMLGEMGIDDVMANPGLDNLHLITAGTTYANPSELIESKLLGEFLAEVRREYDVVVLDTAPILSTADLSVLGTLVDGVLLVYRVGGVSRELLRRAAGELVRVRSNLLGVVLNGMKAGATPDFEDFKAFKYY
ncbi:GumC family protein [Desulfocurvus vexinensis]|uniref:GumC family protein n=1 Tax=Desulfocurvus vexinensis TaxID=399548 RepID=UPI00048CC52C|nr:AAA family ATPase [Desulfocurvus vexinensis]